MGFIIGGLIGISVNVYSNGLRKLPLMHRPWEHVIAFGVGGLAALKLKQFDEAQTENLNQKLRLLGREVGP
eukprot:snap_masked-scaffold_56-processed-gene-1.49-mRNA-1 protein AED:0.43 eAED:0.43 QI:0/-1/0/1/-1/1/1/0/70